MTITGAIVLFAMIWFMCLFVALQVGYRSQREDGEVVPGTPASAPVDLRFGRRLVWVTLATVAIWAPICLVILSGAITIHDIDLMRRFRS
jgi:predicted secreted protein